MTHYQGRLLEILARAKRARSEEERALLFKAAEEWSQKARDAGQPGCDDEILAAVN